MRTREMQIGYLQIGYLQIGYLQIGYLQIGAKQIGRAIGRSLCYRRNLAGDQKNPPFGGLVASMDNALLGRRTECCRIPLCAWQSLLLLWCRLL